MFEAILERILKKILGEYFDGIDSNNLGVALWSGFVTIQNVTIKKQALSKLGLPAKLLYSYIKSLKLQIPWKSLSTSKIEIYFEGLYLILGSQKEEQWPTRNEKLVATRVKEVEDYAAQVVKKFQQNQEAQKEGESGYTDKLLIRIIDNVQIQIKDIHIAYQDEAGFSFGVTLEQFKLKTVNKEGKDQFVDRTKEQNKNQPIRKRLDLSNLGIYWNCRNKSVIPSSLSNIEPYEALKQLIKRANGESSGLQYLILINSEARLLQRPKGAFKQAETTLEVTINSLNVDVENKQLQQMINLSELVQKYQNAMKLKSKINVDVEAKKQMIEQFGQLYRKYLTTDGKLQPSQTERYESILEKIETVELANTIKNEIINRQRKKMIEKKEVKKLGWISYGKKELKQSEVQEIEKFLQQNFAQSNVKISRPETYEYMQLKLQLNEATFSIGRNDLKVSKGIMLKLSSMAIAYSQRTAGYKLKFNLGDLAINLYKKTEHNNELQPFFYKLSKNTQNYVDIVVQGNPIGKEHIDTELKVKVQQSVMMFTPIFITRLKRFIDLKIAQDNKDKAREKIGQLKDMTNESIVNSIQTQKVKVIALDVSIMSPLIILPFEPNNPGSCWCLDTGQLKIQTDQSCLDPKNPPVLEKYRLSVLDINFMWFSSCNKAIQNKAGSEIAAQEELIQQFNIVLDLSLRKNNNNVKTGDLEIRGVLPELALKLSKESYDNLLRMGSCFEDKTEIEVVGDPSSMSAGREREAATSDKKEILGGSEKMGIVYHRSNATKIWTKYICILKQNYLYFFVDKQAQQYEFAIYARNSTFEQQSQSLAGRPNCLVLSNVVDGGVWLSWDKADAMKQWKDMIETKKDQETAAELLLREQESEKKLLEDHKAKTLNYEQLKVDIRFEISSMSLGVYQGVNRKAQLSFQNLCLGIQLFEARKCIQLSLKMIQIKDMIENYEDDSLNYLLYTQQQKQSNNLMELQLTQTDKSDPSYINIDNKIVINFGVLCVVCKPRTISRLLIFFIPSKTAENSLESMEEEMKKQQSNKLQHQTSVSTASDTLTIQSDEPEAEQFSLSLEISFKELKVVMVNKNIRLRQGYLGLQNFVFQLKLSNQGIRLLGGLSSLSLSDCTSHPDTVYRQSQWGNYKELMLLTNSGDNETELLMFNISIQDRPKEGSKPMFIKVLVKDIVVDYYQQPVLRMLHYVLNQLLPSLSPDSQSDNRKLHIEYPEEMKFNLDVTVINTVVRLRPHPTSKDMLRLNVGCVQVKNKDVREKYTHNDSVVLASSFLVTISGLEILYNSMPLTNQFNFYLKVNLIQSPDYYRLHLQEQFNPGMRIDCRMSPFLLRVANLDYRFIMKCLNWNIAYDDGCDRILFPQKFENIVVAEKLQDQDPIYFSLSIDMLTLLVTEGQTPISNMTLNELNVTFTGFSTKMIVTVTIKDIIGSSFRKVGNNYQERGIIRELNVNRFHAADDLNDIKDLVRLFSRSVQTEHSNRLNNDLSVLFERNKAGDMLVEVTLNCLQISLQLRPLLKLVGLISLDESVKAPAPRLSAQVVSVQANSTIKFRLIANEISFRAATDNANQQLGIAGQFFVDMTMKPPMKIEQVIEQSKIQQTQSNIQNSRLSVTINYLELFLLENDGSKIKKRTLLNPSNIILVTKEAYSIKNERLVAVNEVILKLEFVVLEATVSDINKLLSLYTQAMSILNENKQQGARTMSAAQLEAQEQERRLENEQERHAKQFKELVHKMENTNEVIREIVAEVSIRELRVSVLYNSQSIYIPVLMFELFETNPIFKSNLLLAQLSLTCFTQLSFFNPRSSSWEPVIEKNCLEIEYVCTQKQTSTETVIAIQNGSDDQFNRLNINISSQFLTSLAEILSTVKQMQSKQLGQAVAVEEEELEVSPYVVQNMTFEDIQVYSSVQQSTKIQLQSRKRMQSNYNKGRSLEFGEQSKRVIPSRTKRSVYIEPKQKEIYVRIGENKVKVNIEGYAKKKLYIGEYIIETTVEKLNRLLRISGDVLVNRTNRVIELEADSKWLTVHPQQMVPFSTIKRFRMGPNRDLMCTRMDKQDLFVNTSLSCSGKFYYNLVKKEEEVQGMLVSYYSVYSPLKLINCMPKPVQLQVIYKNKTTANRELKQQTDYEIYSHATGQEVKIKISMPGFFWSHDVSIAHSIDKELDIMVKDQEDIPLTIRALMIKNQQTQCISISFFCEAYLLNETPYPFIIYGKKNKNDKYKKIAAQKHGQEDNDLSLVLLGEEVGNYIKLAATQNQLTPKIFIGGIDNSDVELKLKKEDNSEKVVLFSVFTSIKQMHKDSAVVCKEIRVVPKHILVNNTNKRLFIRQEGDDKELDILPTQRKILEYRPNLSKKGIYRLEGSEESTPIMTFGLGVVYFNIMQQGVKLHMKIEIDTADKYVMIVVSLLQLKDTPYCLVNKCKKTVLRVPFFSQIVKPGEHLDFSWKSPEDSRMLKVMTQYQLTQDIKQVQISCDKVGSTSRVEIKPPGDWLVYVIFTVRLKGERRIIEVIEKTVRVEEPKNIVLRTICVKLATISVSLSLNHGTVAKPYEAFNLTIFDLELVDQLGTMEEIYQVRLRFLQLDQNSPHLSPIPVVLTPSKYKLYMDKDNPRKIINLLIRRDSQARRSITLMEVALEINPLTLRVSQMFIKLMLEMLREFTSVMDVKQQEYLIQRKKDEWSTIPIVFTRNPIYINEIRISPLDLDITAQLKPPDEGKANIVILRMVLKGFGLVVANIDEAPIRLNGITISGCLDSLSGIIQKLIAHYKKNFILEVYKLFGSFNALGNPASLFSNIATGLGDLVQKPAEGLVKGPLELGLGIVEGTHSLVAHTIGGAFNSVSKITGTISSGIALLAFDKNFEAMREKQRMKKPKNVLQGLEKGAKAIYRGFKEGMTGVFLKPFEEAKKDGVLGFFRGTAQGLTGVIIKPVTGILDFAANTTEGIKNTALYFEDRANQNRMRCPIVFYGRNSEMHQFVPMDTQINNVLQPMKQGKFSNSMFIKAFMLEDKAEMLAILNDYIVMLSIKKKTLVWYIRIRSIKNMRVEQGVIKLSLSENHKYFDGPVATIESSIPEQQEMIKELIEEQVNFQKI